MTDEFSPADAGPVVGLEFRRLLGLAVIVSMPFAFGVYWLRQLPIGPAAHTSDPFIKVNIVRSPDPGPVRPETPPRTGPSSQAVRQDWPTEEPEHQIDAPDVPEVSPTAPGRPDSEVSPHPPPLSPGSPPSSVVAKFQKALLAHIARYRRYPDGAQRGHLQGVVELLFAMQRDGAVLDIWVRTSSGQVVLDQAAIDTVRRAQPLPSIPPELPDGLNILIPVAFAR